MTTIDWNTIKKVHCVGMGGIGLSGLARLLAHQGITVAGCDRSSSVVTERLNDDQIEVILGHDAKHIDESVDLLIYSDAVAEGSEGYAERARAEELHIPQLSYFQALGAFANTYKVIAVSGAHGKTSTTAMLADVLEAAGLDPTSNVGSLRAKTKSNFYPGKGEYFVVEADEYLRHFLAFNPYIAVITNIDADHLDYYKDLADVQSAFRAFVEKVPTDGFVVCDPKHPNVAPVIEGLSCTVVDYTAYYDPELPLRTLPLHRINAAAVLAVADILHIDTATARKALFDFAGTWRRFEYKGITQSGALVYDDYGHHPTEVHRTLESVREQFPDKRIVLAFHPHLYSRTKLLFKEFTEAFNAADEIVLAPIFAAREAPDPSISSEMLAGALRAQGKNAQAFGSLQSIEEYLRGSLKEGDLLITMGAGDIYKVAEALL